MNILYITFVDIEDKDSVGVKKKILGQVKGMKQNGHNVSYTACDGYNFNVYDSTTGSTELIYKFKNNRHKRLAMYNKNLMKLIVDKNIDIIYMRYALSDPLLIDFLRKVKKVVNKIYIEIPTYPYDNEISSKKLKIDRFFRKYLKKYVSNIILSSNKIDKVFGIDSIFVDNCVDVESISCIKQKYDKDKKNINMIAVSFIRKSNGYDRLIEGMKEYYDSDNTSNTITLTFIGTGSEEQNLKTMVKEYGLSDYIYFKGIKIGDELDYYFEQADIAIGSLGDHRVGIYNKSPLKSREYCARGIPFISSVKDPGFDGNESFILNVESNDSPINMNVIIEFIENIKNEENIRRIMRDYSYNRFDWKSQYNDLFRDSIR